VNQMKESNMNKIFLKLFISGNTTQSHRSIAVLRQICEEELKGVCKLNIINVTERPELAEQERILATPTLVKETPPHSQRIIGDLSNKEKILKWININSK